MEYGRIVGESTGISRGGGASGDVTGQLMDAVSDAVERVAALPPEVLIGAAVIGLIALVILRR